MIEFRQRSVKGWDSTYHEFSTHNRAQLFGKQLAFAPFIAGVLAGIPHEKIKILVMGGGKGDFSRNIWPRVHQLLNDAGVTRTATIVEQDYSDAITHAPNSSRKLISDFTRLAVKPGQFHLIVSDSALHLSPDLLQGGIHEAARALHLDGVLVHVNHSNPPSEEWEPELSRERDFSAALGVSGDLIETFNDDVRRRVQADFQKAFQTIARNENLQHLLTQTHFQGSIRTDAQHLEAWRTQQELDANRASLHDNSSAALVAIAAKPSNFQHVANGIEHAGHDPARPSNQLHLDYSAEAYLAFKRANPHALLTHIKRFQAITERQATT